MATTRCAEDPVYGRMVISSTGMAYERVKTEDSVKLKNTFGDFHSDQIKWNRSFERASSLEPVIASHQ